ncbi:heavy-metal-associated domain-containing protein [Flavobacterium cerinum]|uniref:Cation transporter n=1 Tax=Flavobacterium cerinum TaxID=2502784 RepID=A0ABY5IZ52_9FLAO|nr:heavy metal-associated domain-containing protein [Flavobacterium cerinum]UUC46609.1 cation transporter [Flavobacterium cerinum]
MNITKKIAVLTFATFALVSCKKEEKNTTEGTVATENTKEVAAKMETASFTIEGMTCAMGCAATIENKLGRLDGVTSAKVDFETKTATVEFDANKQTATTLTQTVEGVADGKTYKVSHMKSEANKA